MKINLWISGVAMIVSMAYVSQAYSGEIERNRFGNMADGTAVEAITLKNKKESSVTIISYGAAVQAVRVKDKNAQLVDIALGYNTLEEYTAKRQFMGSTVGRVANRIDNAQFSLGGKNYQVPANEGANALHGGVAGFDTAIWQIKGVKSGKDYAEVELSHISPDGDQGFPGNLTTTVKYRLEADNSLLIEYTATTDKDTVVNISNHAYWNLAGEGSSRGAMGLVLQTPANRYLPVNGELIPSGEVRSVAGTVFDFRQPRVIGDGVRDGSDEQIVIGRGYDHNWVVTSEVTAKLHFMVKVFDPKNGIAMELWSNQPGLQFYSGNFMDASTIGKSGKLYRQGDAIVLEPQTFPNAVNQKEFGSIVLKPKKTYQNKMIYKFSVEK